MFTGIIETIGKVLSLEQKNQVLQIRLQSDITSQLKIDQSLAHDGICLTVDEINSDHYRVTAIPETIKKTTISAWKVDQKINLERCLLANGRLDGHMVQGHVDDVLKCLEIHSQGDSWDFWFQYPITYAPLLIPQGSVCINGISLTVADLLPDRFKVSIIPYTYAHTSIREVCKGDLVNVEFDVLGKYILRNQLLRNH